MAFDITAITGYIDESKNELIAAMTASNTSARVLNLQTGYKSSGTINILDTDIIFQDGSVGGFTPAGTTTLSQRVLTVGHVKVQEALDPKSLNKTFLQHQVKAGSYENAIPFEQEYTTTKAAKIASVNEKAIWQGDTTSADVNLNKYDGFLKIFAGESTIVDGNTSVATEITKANVIGLVDDMYAVVPTDVLEAEDLVLMVGFDVARNFSAALKDADLTHYKPEEGRFSFAIPGTNVTLHATSGLNGTDSMILSKASNMVIGVDLENEEEKFQMVSAENDFGIVKFNAEFKTGVQIAFPQELVLFTV